MCVIIVCTMDCGYMRSYIHDLEEQRISPIPCGQDLCRLLDRIRADLPVLDAG